MLTSFVCLGSSHLHSDLREVHLHGQLLSAVHVRVVGLLKGTLQLVQLVGGEGGAVASVLLLGLIVLAQLRGLVFVALCTLPQLTEFFITLVCKQARVCSGNEIKESGMWVGFPC